MAKKLTLNHVYGPSLNRIPIAHFHFQPAFIVLPIAMTKKSLILNSHYLSRQVILDVYEISAAHAPSDLHPMRLLVLNDGQDAPAYLLEEVLKDLEDSKPDHALLAVAVHVGERKQEYGISHRPDYAGRGSRAHLYQSFIARELIPYLENQYPVSPNTRDKAVAGFSLGALSAFDLAWHLPHVFGVAGLFSGSFWWRSRALEDGYSPNDRIVLNLIDDSEVAPELSFWFQTGWLDEKADRDDDGLIDSIGDTLDTIQALRLKGYKPGQQLEYIELGAGKHDHPTMAQVFPVFLNWWNSILLPKQV